MSLHYDHKAAYPGLCPLCCTGFRAGTVIEPLIAPTVPNPRHCAFYAEREAWLMHGQYAKKMHARWWAHRRCTKRLDHQYSADDQIALAQTWRDELAAMKREAIRTSDRHAGRHPKRGRAAT